MKFKYTGIVTAEPCENSPGRWKITKGTELVPAGEVMRLEYIRANFTAADYEALDIMDPDRTGKFTADDIELLLDRLTPQGDDEGEIHTEDCRCPKCCAENPQAAAHKKLLDEREAKRKAMYGDNEPPPHGELKPPENTDFDENAPQKMAGSPAPVSKEDLRNKYIAILEKVGKLDRSAWMKSKQQVGLMSTPNVHTMPIEKLIEWATLAQSMLEGEKDIKF